MVLHLLFCYVPSQPLADIVPDYTNIVSLISQSSAIIKPVSVLVSTTKEWTGNKDKCPKQVCTLKKE